ncbi:hypothetical protein XNC1_3054 [Xenorhabdus nematophila ATCC 19061]|uniref:Uncharacterized protein n=2 Tax=Xenorhabdus nematophila TaxID=628 RepID=D3VK49_XENNA|nr:hypothetical protein [Xenorhabdus nematophila]CBJ91108.1 hypothetical protein XNC1_3054 [Xenorhabdus nematophila ATCC 19061]
MIITQINAHGLIIQELADELDLCGISYNRSPMYFSAGALEWLQIALPAGASAARVFIAVIVAKINKNRRAKVTFNDGSPIKEIEAASPEDLKKVYEYIKSIEIERQ